MYAASVGKKQLGKTFLIIIALIAVVLIAFCVIGKIKDKNSSDNGNAIPGETAEQREDYLRSIGVQVDPTSSIAEVKVPDEFDERFNEYNAMLKLIGFDLTEFKGETVKKCTYAVTNKSEMGENISAVLLIYKDRVVAGHLLNAATGVISPLFVPSAEDNTEETILPSADIPQLPSEGEQTEETIAQSDYPTE
ncbi:MAG: DUF4830 domain-containing protein [Oscillospiraceae bacterium]